VLSSAVAVLLFAGEWKSIAPGVEYADLVFDSNSKISGFVHVVRIDPAVAELQFALRSKAGGAERTASQWADDAGFVAVMNAGMFDTDHLSSVGRLVDGKHENKAGWNAYQSALVFGPTRPGLPRAQLLDLDAPGGRETAAQYASMVQNLRLIKAPGVNVWKKNGRAWSEAALAQDKKGRLLFLFTREAYEMAVFNDLLLALKLDIVRACHAEGGPEASLSVHAKDLRVDFAGSFETGFLERDDNKEQWALPNVVGVKAPTPPPSKAQGR
jgi:hypothetical protein